MLRFDHEKIVSTGFWYYNKHVKTGVAIQKMAIIYGSGDYEDPPEIQNDREIENYYIWFATSGSVVDFKNGAGYKLSIEEAKVEAERLVEQSIDWKDLQK
jgi:hypothetical protein